MQTEYKVYYRGVEATQKQLDAIEEIVVEQEIGRAWEARITIPVRITENGSWDAEDDPAYQQYARVRVEVRIGERKFVPLIDGKIVKQDPGMNSAPGSSTLTLTVHDDTKLLHREAASEQFRGKSTSEIARSLLFAAALGGDVKVDDTGAQPDTEAVVQRRGTRMQLLRSLMARHKDFYAYVLPGKVAGTSDGCFKKLPTTPDSSLPDLVLTGPTRNITRFNVQRLADKATTHEGRSLSFADKKVRKGSFSSTEVRPTDGDTATIAGPSDVRARRLPPGIGDHTSMKDATDGAAFNSSFTVLAEGSVLHCYGAILSPYRMVRARVSDSRYSTNYVIFRVTHTLGVSEYTQSFSVRGNAVSGKKSSSTSIPAVAASITAVINLQRDIF